jgi:phage major head subunit gpT-like protein
MKYWERLAADFNAAKSSGSREKLESWGKGAHDYSILTVKGYLGDLFAGLEGLVGGSWAPRIGIKIQSDQKTEFYRWLGPPPMLREWLSDRQAKGMPIYAQVVTNKLYEATLDVAAEDWRFDKKGMLSVRFGELGVRANQHWELLATLQLEGNSNSYDGQAMFSATHTLGGASPTMDNDLTSADVPELAFASPTNPTASEFSAALVASAQKFYGFRDAANIPINGGLSKVLVMVPVNMFAAAQQAVSMNRLNFGQDNPLKFQNVAFEVVCNPFLGNTDNSPANANRLFYLFREDARIKPLILQEAVAPEVEFQGPGSHIAFTQNKYLLGIKAERAVGNGAWEHALRCTAG